MMILEYAENGSLRNFLDKSYKELSWNDKLFHLYHIAFGLAGRGLQSQPGSPETRTEPGSGSGPAIFFLNSPGPGPGRHLIFR